MRQTSRQFTTCHDNLRHLWRHDNLWHFLSRPLPPVPFWISPAILGFAPCSFGLPDISRAGKRAQWCSSSVWRPSGRAWSSAKSAKTKRGRREGDGKKRHENLRQTSRQFLRHYTTIREILWQFPSLCSIDKTSWTSQIVIKFVIKCHDNLRHFTTIYDIFCPAPFLPSPFGFRRLRTPFWGPCREPLLRAFLLVEDLRSATPSGATRSTWLMGAAAVFHFFSIATPPGPPVNHHLNAAKEMKREKDNDEERAPNALKSGARLFPGWKHDANGSVGLSWEASWGLAKDREGKPNNLAGNSSDSQSSNWLTTVVFRGEICGPLNLLNPTLSLRCPPERTPFVIGRSSAMETLVLLSGHQRSVPSDSPKVGPLRLPRSRRVRFIFESIHLDSRPESSEKCHQVPGTQSTENSRAFLGPYRLTQTCYLRKTVLKCWSLQQARISPAIPWRTSYPKSLRASNPSKSTNKLFSRVQGTILMLFSKHQKCLSYVQNRHLVKHHLIIFIMWSGWWGSGTTLMLLLGKERYPDNAFTLITEMSTFLLF